MSVSEKTVLFIKVSEHSFVAQDGEILNRRFHSVVPVGYSESRHLRSQVRMLFSLVKWIRLIDVIYIWFASYHSVLPTLFGRVFRVPSVIVIGGHDAARVPELQYGAHLKRLRSWCSRASCKLATKLLTVSKFTHENVFTFIGDDQRYKTELVYNGVDTGSFKPLEEVERKSRVVAVCGTRKMKVLFVKGIDFFLRVARELPGVEFLVVGLQGAAMEWCSGRRPSNVSLMGPMDREALRRIFSTSRVVCQFSRYEAFGLALAEGMAMGCIPVGYNYGGTPEVIDGVGHMINELEVNEGVSAVTKALRASYPERELARRRVVSNFSLSVREASLTKILSRL